MLDSIPSFFQAFDFKALNLVLAAPEMFLLLMSCVILLLDLGDRSPKKPLAFWLTQLSLIGVMAVAWYARPQGLGEYAFNFMYVSDLMALVLKEVVYASVLLTLFYSRDYLVQRPTLGKGEYYVLALLSTLGMSVMISANHFLPLYLGLEIMSLSLYAMTALNRDSVVSTEAAMKYFVLGALASGFLLYGMSMIYGATGSLIIPEIGDRLNTLATLGLREINLDGAILALGLVFIVAAIAFKLGAAPFHMWLPDVYQGAPTSVTLFIAAAPKLAGFAIMMRLLVVGMPSLHTDWQSMLMVVSVFSIVLGNLVAIVQTNIKRMLGYSAISHMGFMLMGMAASDPLHFMDAYASAFFYAISYVVMTLATFGIVLLLSRVGFEADQLESYKGLNKRHPWFAAMMMIAMLSMAGIPFFVGFFAKFYVLQTAVLAGYLWFALIAVLFSVVGAFYYLRVIKYMYFDEPGEAAARVEGGLFVKLMVSGNALAVALLGLFPERLLELSQVSVRTASLVF